MQIKKQILDSEKKLDIKQFFPDNQEELEIFVTIKRLSRSDLLKIGLFVNSVTADKNKEQIKSFFDNIDFQNQAELEQKAKVIEVNGNLYFDFGVDENKHSFWVEKEGDFKLNSETFFQAFPGNFALFYFIIEEVKNFSTSFLS